MDPAARWRRLARRLLVERIEEWRALRRLASGEVESDDDRTWRECHDELLDRAERRALIDEAMQIERLLAEQARLDARARV